MLRGFLSEESVKLGITLEKVSSSGGSVDASIFSSAQCGLSCELCAHVSVTLAYCG